jgi:hypothetical protein
MFGLIGLFLNVSFGPFFPQVSLTASLGAAGVVDGNSNLVIAMFNSTNSSVLLETTVKKISREGNDLWITYADKTGHTERKHADHVVIACPIEFSNVEFDNITIANISSPRSFVKWIITFVRARAVNPTFFGLSSNSTQKCQCVRTANSGKKLICFRDSVFQL